MDTGMQKVKKNIKQIFKEIGNMVIVYHTSRPIKRIINIEAPV